MCIPYVSYFTIPKRVDILFYIHVKCVDWRLSKQHQKISRTADITIFLFSRTILLQLHHKSSPTHPVMSSYPICANKMLTKVSFSENTYAMMWLSSLKCNSSQYSAGGKMQFKVVQKFACYLSTHKVKYICVHCAASAAKTVARINPMQTN